MYREAFSRSCHEQGVGTWKHLIENSYEGRSERFLFLSIEIDLTFMERHYSARHTLEMETTETFESLL